MDIVCMIPDAPKTSLPSKSARGLAHCSRTLRGFRARLKCGEISFDIADYVCNLIMIADVIVEDTE
jgi:hypothetical protein